MELQGVFLLFSSVRMKSFFLVPCCTCFMNGHILTATYSIVLSWLSVIWSAPLFESTDMSSSCTTHLYQLFWWRVGKSTVFLMCTVLVIVASCFLSPVLIHIVLQLPEHVWFWPHSEHFSNIHNAIIAKKCSFKTWLQMLCDVLCMCT